VEVADVLVNHGANTKVENSKGETPGNLCTNPELLALLGEEPAQPSNEEQAVKFTRTI
jgi:hypothetical protein